MLRKHYEKKKSSVSGAMRKMTIKTPLRFHLILVEMDMIKHKNDDKHWLSCGERRILTNS